MRVTSRGMTRHEQADLYSRYQHADGAGLAALLPTAKIQLPILVCCEIQADKVTNSKNSSLPLAWNNDKGPRADTPAGIAIGRRRAVWDRGNEA
jgi:hypothetical protein